MSVTILSLAPKGGANGPSIPPSPQSEIYNVAEKYLAAGGEHFALSPDFLKKFRGKKPNFGFNGLGEFVFYRTYSRLKANGQKETFLDVLKRVVEGCYEIQRRHCNHLHIPWDYDKAQASAQEMFQRMWDFKFLPPGRGLWMMGTKFMWERGSAALNNCFRGDTEIITRDGIRQIGGLVGTTQSLLTTGGKWVEAPIKSFGKQELYKLTLERSGVEKVIYTTADHRWFARDRRYQEVDIQRTVEQANACQAYTLGKIDQQVIVPPRTRTSAFQEFKTTELRPGVHCLRYVFGQGIQGNVRPSPFGVAHGIAFGDGTTGSDSESCGTYLYLCGKKNEELLEYFPNCPATPDTSKGEEGAIRVADLPRFFRRPPSLRESKSYLYGWLAGYFAADGKVNKKGNCIKICSSNHENMLLVRDVCTVLGIGTCSIIPSTHTVRHKGQVKKFVGYEIGLMGSHLRPDFFLLSEHRSRFEGHTSHRERPVYHWRVKSVEATGEMAEVFCPQVPDTHAFALADNILTGNCGFVSTSDLSESDPAEPFCFLMDMSMLGVGVGFDTKGAGKIHIYQPNPDIIRKFIVPDSREGWVDSIRHLIRSYTSACKEGIVEFDYSEIRPEGSDINGFGGKSSGPGILMELHVLIRAHLDGKVGNTLDSVDITDLMNYIGRCVVAGNVRRTAEIAFGDADDEAYCSMKNATKTLAPEDMDAWWEVTGKIYAAKRNSATKADFEGKNIPDERLIPAIQTWNALNHHRWASNNSIFAKLGMDYRAVGQQIGVNGEPGIIWLNNVRDYGRMCDGLKPGIDGRVMGANPCMEQSLESYELCNLVETFPSNHEDADDYMRTLKFAYLYAKTVTLLPTHNRRTNQVTLRNRRIGLSQSGIVEAFAKFGRRTVLKDFCDAGYNEVRRWDQIYSEWMCVPKSIKVTSVKPSGTVSLVVGVSPGIHHPEAGTYWRLVRVAKDSVLVKILREAGFKIEPVLSDPDRTVVIYFGVKGESGVRPVGEVTIWEQMQNAVDYQRYWADNQVSCTVKFKPHEAADIGRVLEAFEDQLKGISFLPHEDHGYAQAPYTPCTPSEVEAYNSKLGSADYSEYLYEAVGSMGCDNDKCVLPGA